MSKVDSFISTNRKDFNKGELSKANINTNPFALTEEWVNDAINENVNEPYAFNLATSNNNKPTSRIVYLRGLSTDGYIFYTNYHGRKGKEISHNNHVCMNFFWPELERQIRIEGTVSKLSEELSDEYFASRPRKSQLGAWASNQSDELLSHDILEERLKVLEDKYKGLEVPRPEHWGGYLIKPTYFEFWQGRPSRLHDRLTFSIENDWEIKRLNP